MKVSCILIRVCACVSAGACVLGLAPIHSPISAIPSAEVQRQNAPKRPPLIPPKRTIAIAKMEVKLTTGSAPSGVSISAGVNNNNASGSSMDGAIQITNVQDFADGISGMMITSLTESKGFSVLDLSSSDPGASAPADAELPELKLSAVVTDMTCRKRSGGISIGDLSGGQGQYENKVVMDVRLVDPVTNLVVDSVKATGRKTSKVSIFGATKYNNSSWNPNTKILDLGYSDFEDSPLAEATRLATQDAIKKLIEKAQKRPWEAKVIKIVQEDSGPEFYLNVNSECGLQVGDELELLQLGEVLTDDKTGKVLGRKRPQLLGKLIVTLIDLERSICAPLGESLPKSLESIQLFVRQKS